MTTRIKRLIAAVLMLAGLTGSLAGCASHGPTQEQRNAQLIKDVRNYVFLDGTVVNTMGVSDKQIISDAHLFCRLETPSDYAGGDYYRYEERSHLPTHVQYVIQFEAIGHEYSSGHPYCSWAKNL